MEYAKTLRTGKAGQTNENSVKKNEIKMNIFKYINRIFWALNKHQRFAFIKINWFAKYYENIYKFVCFYDTPGNRGAA